MIQKVSFLSRQIVTGDVHPIEKTVLDVQMEPTALEVSHQLRRKQTTANNQQLTLTLKTRLIWGIKIFTEKLRSSVDWAIFQ